MNIRKILIMIFVFGVIFISDRNDYYAQPRTQPDSVVIEKGFPVLLKSDMLFQVYGSIGTFTAEKRAEEISGKLEILSKDDELVYDSIKIFQHILLGEKL
ncbi:MAG: hypothetical protein FJ214_08985 [Ignavibacteria bacterium]|nr:hypothetical protein [Ignavibacteria bacterium]